MSKVKIQGNASGTGVFTIEAPGTNDPRTLILPDSTGTLLDENSSLPAANLTGTVADARISTLTSSKLSGALPILDGSNLTGLPIQAEEDYWSLDMSSASGTTVHSITASFTPKLAWMTYNNNGATKGMVNGWLNVAGNTSGCQNNGTPAAGTYTQGSGFFQCITTAGTQWIEMTASASGQYTITNTHPGGSPTGTGYFSLILFGN